MPLGSAADHTTLGPDEIVEDAGLFDHEQTLEKGGRIIEILN